MKCPKCGAANDEGAITCSLCGETLAASPPPVSVAPPPPDGVSVPPPVYAPPTQEVKTNGLAIAALVLGILGFCTYGLTALVGLILGIVALSQIKSSEGRMTGSGLATGGIITSSVALVLIPIIAVMAAIMFPVFAKAREKARQTTCLSNQRQIATSILMFAQDHDGILPDATTWTTSMAASYGVTGKVWDCPTTSNAGTESNPDYGFNALLSGIELGKIADPATTLLTAETNAGNLINSAADLDNLRHNNGSIVSYVDGHVAWIGVDEPVKLQP
ncbi:MAG: DUF4190 domain-containing protein [Armatimonadota bacterium]